MKTILMIDDDQDITDIVQFMVGQQSQLSLVIAHEGREGVELAAAQKPDLLLLDIMLPDQTGDEILVQIRALDGLKHMPVLFLTGLVSQSDHAGAKNPTILAKGQRYPALAKPFSQEELISRILKLTGIRHEK